MEVIITKVENNPQITGYEYTVEDSVYDAEKDYIEKEVKERVDILNQILDHGIGWDYEPYPFTMDIPIELSNNRMILIEEAVKAMSGEPFTIKVRKDGKFHNKTYDAVKLKESINIQTNTNQGEVLEILPKELA